MVNICQEGQSVFLFQIWGEVLFFQILRKGSIIKKKKSKLLNVTINMVDSFNSKKTIIFKKASQVNVKQVSISILNYLSTCFHFNNKGLS